MPRNNRGVRLVSACALVLLLACACASGGSRTADRSAPAKASSPSAPFADAFACTNVQALLGHLAVGTARWSPTRRPFDRAVAHEIRMTSESLQRQLPQVRTVAVRRAVGDSAMAFATVASAMTAKHRSAVGHAIDSTRVAYRHLKVACRV